ncbi:MAG: alpha/beta hydrolase [Burkholderiales bacterium]|nr:alpha/beta hydrolase [Burkholderiales bacterium]
MDIEVHPAHTRPRRGPSRLPGPRGARAALPGAAAGGSSGGGGHRRFLTRRRACAAAAAALLLAACTTAPGPGAGRSAPDPAPPYNARTTHEKLVAAYPFIRIASGEPPPDVRVQRGLVYAAPGGRPLALDLFQPAGAAAGPRPLIVLVHGGGWRSGERANLAPLAIGLAQRGYAAASVSYRLSPEAGYPAAVHDVKAAVRWLRDQAPVLGIDATRIAVGGGSAGGQIAALVGVTSGNPAFDPPADAGAAAASTAVQAIVNIDGLSDFTSEAARFHEDDPRKNPSAAGAWFGGRYAEQAARWHEASPITHVHRGMPPVLWVTSGEPRFALGQAEMAARMTALGVPHRRVHLPGTPHSFWLFEPWLAPTVQAVADFLDTHFGAAPR